MQAERSLSVLNSTEYIDVAGVRNVPAKIDTGADSSAIWASDIKMAEDGTLSFVLFGQGSPLYTGERQHFQKYIAKSVRSSHGDKQIRYQVELNITLKDQTFATTFTLADRSRNHFPVLIGRRTLKNRFLVDVTRSSAPRPKAQTTKRLNKELRTNPHEFHQKYIERSN